MDAHFRAFSFVDRISSLQPGVSIRGSYAIPTGIKAFSGSLVAEAVGQLAAWAAMAAMDFKYRPVAGLAAVIEFLAPVYPGQVLDLAVTLETVDNEAAAYGGTAHVNGNPIIRLQHCVGPMLPVEEFDDPQALRERFALLQGKGATPGAFSGVSSLTLEHTHGEAGRSLHATLHVPTDASFFGDHFPRRPVFPGTLLMNANLELVTALAGGFAAPQCGGKWVLRRISDVKLRAFTPPGVTLETEGRVDRISEDAATVTVESRNGKRVVCGARVLLEATPQS